MSEPRFLIVKFSAIGDCVMAVPVASAIRRTFPNAFVAWAVDPRCEDVIDTRKLVDLRFEVPRQRWKRDRTSWLAQFRHFAHLRRFKFDYGLDLQGHSKTALCLRIAQPKLRIASRATDIMVGAINPVVSRTSAPRHTVERNLFVLRMLVDTVGSAEPMMPDIDTLPEMDPQVRLSNLVTIAVGAGSPKKCYSLERWADVGKALIARGFDVVYLGGVGDSAPNVPQARDWVGKLTLAGTMAAIAQSQVHLAADTGTGHIAAAYGVPVVSIFGYTDPEEYRPYTEAKILLNAGKSMDCVTPGEVVEAAESLLTAKLNAISD